MMEIIIAATGHRPDKLGGHYGFRNGPGLKLTRIAKDWLTERILNDFENKYRVISGMALGWDQCVAQAALDLNVPFDAYVPFAGQEKLWPEYQQAYYNHLLACARKVVFVSDPGYSPVKMQKRNRAMVNDCTEVLAMWNGTTGGTNNCIIYAQSRGKPVHNLWEKFVRQSQ